jgi:hypothetical protein
VLVAERVPLTGLFGCRFHSSIGHWANILKLEANTAIPSRQSREAVSILRLRCMEVPSWAIAVVLRLDLAVLAAWTGSGIGSNSQILNGRKKTLRPSGKKVPPNVRRIIARAWPSRPALSRVAARIAARGVFLWDAPAG